MRDYVAWHNEYDEPDSRLARRLVVVQSQFGAALDHHGDHARILSLCAGQGRDVIGVLAERRLTATRALLIELDERNAAVAERAAREAGLKGVRVLCADASDTDSARDGVPADIVLACGIFGNISDDDIRNAIAHLPSLCAEGADVLWTRGWDDEAETSSVRAWFRDAGFAEVAFEARVLEPTPFSVGTHRLATRARPFAPGVRLFTFVR
ncbi:MAG TPA: methyltransferase domain-containing protein [Dehalococcoidia bacterium]|nr:methyltransferase domain-containing protein [Dehalococcoidia bacterium]